MNRVIRWSLWLVLSLGLGACSNPQPAIPFTPTATALVLATSTPPPTATAIPSSTPLPPTATATATNTPTITPTPSPTPRPPNPLQIEYERKLSYPGSEIVFEQTLDPGVNYSRYIISYRSDGYKIYALLTIPNGPKPATGWPVILFNHGYIPPAQYRTTERYVAYVDGFARYGYIVLKSDYRGHGSSEGRASGGYGSPDYTTDVLNALASIKRYKDADPNRIGMWGHSMGGQVTLRAMVISKEIKAGVIWGGVVASYPDIMTRWTRGTGRGPSPTPRADLPFAASGWRNSLMRDYGTPDQNPEFWASISPNSYLADIAGPLQLHHGLADEEVPVAFSASLYEQMQAARKTVEYYTYPGNDHNISQSFGLAETRSLQWFDKYVKAAAAH